MVELNNYIIETMQRITPYLKWSVIAMVSLAIVAIILLIYIFMFLKKAYLRHRQKMLMKHQAEQGQEKEGFWARVKAFFIRLFQWIGLKKQGQIAQLLKRANEFLELNIGGRGYAYKIPRFLMVGAQGSGKTSLIESLDRRVMGQFPEVPPDGESFLSCHFYETGSVIKVPGEFFIQENAIDSNQKKWDELLAMLVHYRVRKPLDGVILTIPVDELTTINQLDRDSLVRRAQYVRSQLKELQDKVGFTLPIYVVLTKCDLITGFEEFAQALPEDKLRQMLGWSSSFSLGVDFTRQWVDFAFEDIGESVLTAQMEVLLNYLPKEQAEKIMLLPKNMESVRDPLKLYLHEIFSKSDYNRNFFFRGVYFTGKVTSIEDPQKETEETDVQPSKKSVFFEDLLFEKAFAEFRLGLIGQQRLFSISRSINIARIAMIIIFFGWGAGIYYDYMRLQTISDNLQINLKKSYSLIQAQPEEQSVVFISQGLPNVSNESLVFSINTLKRTYNILSSIDNHSLASLFLPSSWSKRLDEKFNECVGVIMNRLIFQPMYYSFIHKLRILTMTSIEDLSMYENETSIFAPLSMPEFLLLRGYVEVTDYYQRAIKAYYELGVSHDIAHLNTLNIFLFNFPLPDEVKNNKEFFHLAIKYGHPKSEVPILDFIPTARGKLQTLFNNFNSALFDTQNNPGFALLKSGVSDTSIAGGSLVQVAEIEKVVKKMEYLTRNITLSTFQWISDQTFNPGPAYDHVINLINKAELFGLQGGFGQELNSLASASIPGLQEKLMNLRSDTTGPLLRVSERQVEAEPSYGFMKLLADLKKFLKQPFMQRIDDPQMFITLIPPGKYLMWNPKEFEGISAHIAVFKDFATGGVQEYPGVLHEHLLLLSKKLLDEHIVTAIARSQTLIDAPDSGDAYSLEDAVRTQVSNLVKVLPIFTKVLETLESYNMTTTYVAIRNLLTGQVYKLLTAIDSYFDSESYYEPLYGGYSWWKGEKNLDFQAYNVQSDYGLKTYLSSQHERIIYLATEYAQPLINFLTQPFMHLAPEKANLLAKWQLIINQVQAYQAKKPANDILKLEHYLLSEINDIDAANCLEKLGPAVTQNTFTENWFAQKNLSLKKELYAQCQKLLNKDATQGYQTLQEFFSANLAQKFPFTGGSLTTIQGEASPDDIRTFFDLYTQYKPSIETYLKQNAQSVASRQAQQFMNEMEKVKQFFSTFLDNPSGSAVPAYKVKVAFRTNKNYEVGANQLLKWIFISGGMKVTNSDNKPETEWQFGTPVGIEFQWVSHGPFGPTPDPKNPALNIFGDTAQIGYQSPWALLKFIMAYQAPRQFVPPTQDKAVHTLMFAIPSQSNYTMGQPHTMMNRFFVNLSIEAIAQKGPALPIQMPYFPAQAPNIK